METVRFKNDAATRKWFMVPESFAHPAKGHIGLWQELIQRYSKEGDTLLDPMAGIGTSLIAALMGRNVICVELEQHFVDPMRRSWEKMRTMPMLGYSMGQAIIIQGDARNLGDVLGLEYPVLEQNPDLAVDAIISSPPYEGSVQGDTSEATRERIRQGEYHGLRPDVFTSPGNVAGSRYGDGYTRPVDAIVTSPPYEGSIQGEPGIDWTKGDDGKRDFTQEPGHANRVLQHSGYTHPVDAIVTSPSYEGTNIGRSESLGEVPFGGPNSQARGIRYAPGNGDNIGNMRGAEYWGENGMAAVYRECWRVLRPGGIMSLVLGNFVRDGLIVDLVSDTIDLCKQQGFQKIDHWQRIKWSLGFWRILQARKGGPVIDREDVVAFRKPFPGNGSVDSLMEKGILPLEPSPPVQWHLSSAKLTSGPSQQLPLSLPREE